MPLLLHAEQVARKTVVEHLMPVSRTKSTDFICTDEAQELRLALSVLVCCGASALIVDDNVTTRPYLQGELTAWISKMIHFTDMWHFVL